VTYAELLQQIQDYTENTETSFVNNIPNFVEDAELGIYNSIQIPNLRKNVTGVTSQGQKYQSCPIDFLSTYSYAVVDTSGNYEFLLNKDVNYLRQAYPNPNDEGIPKHYALFGPAAPGGVISDELTFVYGPTPDASYTVELHYNHRPETIVTAGTTWLSDNMGDVLLYGSLIEAAVYMKSEPDMMQKYQEGYAAGMAQLNRLCTGLERGDTYRDGQAKIEVNP
jgi:hypothetical protein